MSSLFGIVDGWEVHEREDGGFGVYDDHGMVIGPFGTKQAALGAALSLPKGISHAVRDKRTLKDILAIPADDPQ